ncbi:MAG: DUF6476 family protein [Paracoccaceae bacterium]
MSDPSEQDFQEPAQLKFLRRLVTVLTAVMIFGLVAVVTLLVIRLSDRRPTLPDTIALPNGETPQSVTFGNGWYAVVTQNQEILIFDAKSGDILQRIPVIPAQ